MTREIKFRGKRVTDNTWIYGYYYCIGRGGNKKHYILPEYEVAPYGREVEAETVGQYIGLKDKNGTEIYEGDIVRVLDWGYFIKETGGEVELNIRTDMFYREGYDDDPYITKDMVEWKLDTTVRLDVVTLDRCPCFWLRDEVFGYEGEDLISPEETIVIGNIHDNPELLKEVK